MTENRRTSRIYRLFADILEYPGPDLPDRVRECVALLSSVDPETTSPLETFRSFVEQSPSTRLEEIYTTTFDLQVVCYPYVGYQLFGESHKRGAFLVKLKERYRAHGFSAGNELPDHLAVLLRFLTVLQDANLSETLVGECLIPSVESMAQTFGDSHNPYGEVIRALLHTLQKAHRESTKEPVR